MKKPLRDYIRHTTSSIKDGLQKWNARSLQQHEPCHVFLIPNHEDIDYTVGRFFIQQVHIDKVMHAKDLPSLIGKVDANIYFDPTLALKRRGDQDYDLG